MWLVKCFEDIGHWTCATFTRTMTKFKSSLLSSCPVGGIWCSHCSQNNAGIAKEWGLVLCVPHYTALSAHCLNESTNLQGSLKQWLQAVGPPGHTWNSFNQDQWDRKVSSSLQNATGEGQVAQREHTTPSDFLEQLQNTIWSLFCGSRTHRALLDLLGAGRGQSSKGCLHC